MVDPWEGRTRVQFPSSKKEKKEKEREIERERKAGKGEGRRHTTFLKFPSAHQNVLLNPSLGNVFMFVIQETASFFINYTTF